MFKCALLQRICLLVCLFALSINILAFQAFPQEYHIQLHECLKQLENDRKNVNLWCTAGYFAKKLGLLTDAKKYYQSAQQLAPTHSRANRALSHIYLAEGDFTHGWPCYEYRWKQPPSYNREFHEYLQSGGTLHNKIVLLKGEYGLGDTLQFIRYAKLCKDRGAQVILESQPALIPLLSHCPYIDELIPQENSLPGAHQIALLMSMPLIFDTTLSTIPHEIPYLYADDKLVHYWHTKINPDTFNIGICWHADAHVDCTIKEIKEDAQRKSIPLSFLEELATIPNVTLYSLQKIYGLEQLSPTSSVIYFEKLDTDHGPFMDTAALMKNLDLVITIDTSIAHLAGGLGVPVWVLLPYQADWRWLLDRTNSPWYPSMQLFRQTGPRNWQDLIQTVKHHLKIKRILA